MIRRKRILLAHSDERSQDRFRNYFAGQGYDVVTCGDGLACAAELRQQRPDVMVLDPDLPWGSGDGVLALMLDGDLPAVPVIMLSQPSANRLPPGGSPIRAYLPSGTALDRLEETVCWAMRN